LLEDRHNYSDVNINGRHSIRIDNRHTAYITGVKDVVAFDAKEIHLETVQGTLNIKGEQLHINRLSLDKGEVDVDGTVDSMTYSSSSSSKGSDSLLGRLFR